jgi:hypothetical protein
LILKKNQNIVILNPICVICCLGFGVGLKFCKGYKLARDGTNSITASTSKPWRYKATLKLENGYMSTGHTMAQ